MSNLWGTLSSGGAAGLWIGLSLLAAVLWGLQYALWGQLLKHVTPMVGLWWYCLASFLFYSVLLWVKGIPVDSASLSGSATVMLLLATVAVLGFAANVVMLSSFNMANPTVVTMIAGSSPMFTAVFGYLLFKNVDVNPWTVAGFVLILAGVGVVAWSKQ